MTISPLSPARPSGVAFARELVQHLPIFRRQRRPFQQVRPLGIGVQQGLGPPPPPDGPMVPGTKDFRHLHPPEDRRSGLVGASQPVISPWCGPTSSAVLPPHLSTA